METLGTLDNEGLRADRKCLKKTNAMHAWLSSLAFSHHSLSCVIYNIDCPVQTWWTPLFFISRLVSLPPPARVPDGASWVRHRVLQLGRVWGGAAPSPGGRGQLRGNVLQSAGGPEWEHEPGLPARSQRVHPLHRVHEGEKDILRDWYRKMCSPPEISIIKMWKIILLWF